MFISVCLDKMVSVLSVCIILKSGLCSIKQIIHEILSQIISHLLKAYCKHHVLCDLTLESSPYYHWRVLILDRINYINNSLFHKELNKKYQPSKHIHILSQIGIQKFIRIYRHLWLCHKTAISLRIFSTLPRKLSQLNRKCAFVCE